MGDGWVSMRLWQPFNKNFLEFRTFALALAWEAVAGAGGRGDFFLPLVLLWRKALVGACLFFFKHVWVLFLCVCLCVVWMLNA